MTDAEIFRENVKRICKEKYLKMGYVNIEAGYSEKYVSEMACRGIAISIEHVRNYAKALDVEPWRLTEGMFE